jgi:hypothetical protein
MLWRSVAGSVVFVAGLLSGLWRLWLACARMVRTWCAHARRRDLQSRATPPYKSGKKLQKEEIQKIRFVRGNAALLLQKSLLKETCAAAAKRRRRRNGKRKGFWAECLVFFAREFLKVFFGEICWGNLKNHTGFFLIGTELKICVMHIVFIGTSLSFSH